MTDPLYDPFPWIRRGGPFDLGRLFEHPGEDLWGIASDTKRVCIVGGGIAGLAAAFELIGLGHDVHVLEASNRLGGRILTDRFAGTYGELGAMRIPLSHYCVRHYIHNFQLPLRQFVMTNDDAYVLLRHRIGPVRRHELRNIAGLDDKRRELSDYLTDGIGLLDQWRIFDNPGADAATKLWSCVSIWQYIQRWVVPGSTELRLRAPLLSRDEWEYAGRIDGLIWDEHAANLEAAVDDLIFGDPAMFEIPGGMDALVHAFAYYLDGTISLRSVVKEIRPDTSPGRVIVRWLEDGRTTRSAEFQFVICAIPPACLVHIDWGNELPREQWEALTKVTYGSAAKAVIHCDQRPWEFVDGIFGGASFTDMPIEQLWYPSDNAAPAAEQLAEEAADPDAQPQLSARGALSADPGLGYEPHATRWEARPGASLYGPGTLLAYAHGDNARRFAALPDRDRRESVLSCLRELHPGIERYVRKIRCVAWDNEVNPGTGAFAMFNPGEQMRYGNWIAQPVGDRVFFAGEHVAGAHAWVQTSIQTALGAVWHVLSA